MCSRRPQAVKFTYPNKYLKIQGLYESCRPCGAQPVDNAGDDFAPRKPGRGTLRGHGEGGRPPFPVVYPRRPRRWTSFCSAGVLTSAWSFYIYLGDGSSTGNHPGATAPPLLIQEGSSKKLPSSDEEGRRPGRRGDAEPER